MFLRHDIFVHNIAIKRHCKKANFFIQILVLHFKTSMLLTKKYSQLKHSKKILEKKNFFLSQYLFIVISQYCSSFFCICLLITSNLKIFVARLTFTERISWQSDLVREKLSVLLQKNTFQIKFSSRKMYFVLIKRDRPWSRPILIKPLSAC